jgi:hypothetical protein
MYLFCVRHFNDIDHIAPIVWKMKQDNYPVAVYCINPNYDIQNDHRLNFLKEQGIIVEYMYKAFDQNLGELHRTMRFLYMWLFSKGKRLNSPYQEKPFLLLRLTRLAAEILGVISYELTRISFYNTKWAHNVLEHSGAQALFFDHIMPQRYVVDVLLRAAKKMSIPTFSLPHGVYLFTNDFTKAKSTVSRRFTKFNRFDYVIVQNQLRKDVLVRSGVAEEKIFVLGSSRYCGEWIAQNKKIMPRLIKPNDKGTAKLKVIFMTSKPQCRVDIERMLNTFDLLSNLSEIQVMVKPHTRMGARAKLFDNLPLFNASGVLTAELCEWADVMLIIGSSVMTEALMQGRPVLYLKYLHANTTLFEEYGACWTIQNETELENALQSLKINKMDVPYSDENVNGFLSEVVYGGRHKRDVLKDYEQFIMSCTES